MKVRFTMISGNGKTGPIPTSMTSRSSCPLSCPARNECYAAYGPISWAWKRVDEYAGSHTWDGFCSEVRRLRKGQLWRHNTAGDLPGCPARGSEYIDAKKLDMLVAANKGRRGFTYTHKLPSVGDNARLIAYANKSGFAISLSANNIGQADEYVKLGIAPVVTILPSSCEQGFSPGKFEATTPAGNRVVVCPASREGSSIQCVDCALCQKIDRKTIVGFPAHGIMKTRLDQKLNNNQ